MWYTDMFTGRTPIHISQSFSFLLGLLTSWTCMFFSQSPSLWWDSTCKLLFQPPSCREYRHMLSCSSAVQTTLLKKSFQHLNQWNWIQLHIERQSLRHIKHSQTSTTHSGSQTSSHSYFFPEQARITALLVIVTIFGMVHKFSRFF